jgi:hypothetical protein
MKTKRSTTALWLFTCLTLVATLASRAQTQTFVVDDFAPAGVSPSNPTNHNHYPSAQNYSSGQIDAVYWNWFGGAFVTNQWDSTSDASNNPSSGSLKISLNWSSANSQFVLWDQGTNNNFFALGLNALTFTNFQCDVRFAPGSASDVGNRGAGAQPIFGHLQFGLRTSGYGQDYFGGVDIVATNTNWVHVSITLNALSDANLLNMGGLLIHIDRNYYSLNLNGASTLWVDNIKFVGSATAITNLPPSLGLQKANPGLRIFAGSTVDTYDREELATVDQKQSWIGGTYPVSYSYTLLSYPGGGNMGQVQIFLIPTNSANGNNIYNNQFIDYNAKNGMWLLLNPQGSSGGVTAAVQWKTNLPNANPDHTALTITNPTAIGTWTLTFTGPNAGTLTAPNAGAVPFTITNGTVATDFANPLVAYFGLQPNYTAGYGEYLDYASISVAGVAGVNENDNFATDSSLNTGLWNTSCSAKPSSVVLATASTPYWVNWSLPDTGFTDTNGNSYGFIDGNGNGYLAVVTSLTSDQWVVPEYYNGYIDGLNIPGTAQQGNLKWTLIPSTCLPTVNGQPQSGQPLSPDAFFRLYNTEPPNP